MTSPCVGPASIFLRCKVADDKVLSVLGETLARHLNCVFIDEKDKEVDAVRQCLFRAMISTQQAPRWVFKDFELGWLEVDEDHIEEEVPPSRDGEEVVVKEKSLYQYCMAGSIGSRTTSAQSLIYLHSYGVWFSPRKSRLSAA